jgi:hypothetical protein
MAHSEPGERKTAWQCDGAGESEQSYGENLQFIGDANGGRGNVGNYSSDAGGDPGALDADIERDHAEFHLAAKSSGGPDSQAVNQRRADFFYRNIGIGLPDRDHP